jgi:23S rRNA pseudouridine1911/1915/1917 synthase
VEPRQRPQLSARAEPIPLKVLYEDEDVLVVNKPAGMVVHAGAGRSSGTLVNALLGQGQRLSTGPDALRPGIVHRLDRQTSGAILVAKNDTAHARLAEAFRARAVRKTYVALVEGLVHEERGRIELPIARHPRRRTRMAVMAAKRFPASAKVRQARTDWRVLARLSAPGPYRGGGLTLVELQLHTGRTHQIRVHFAALGHPVVGDVLYGSAKPKRGARRTALVASEFTLKRNFLHAARLAFQQPRTGGWIEVTAPLPLELRDFLHHLTDSLGHDVNEIDARIRAYL